MTQAQAVRFLEEHAMIRNFPRLGWWGIKLMQDGGPVLTWAGPTREAALTEAAKALTMT